MLLKRYTCACGCACSAKIFLGLRKRLRRKNFRVVKRALARNYCDLRCLPLSKTIGGDADVDHSQIIGEIYSPIPTGFRQL